MSDEFTFGLRMLQPLNQPASHEATQEGEPHAIAQAISSKQQTFNTLLEIAGFFSSTRTSAICSLFIGASCTLGGNLPLPDLLAQLMPDPKVLGFSLQLIGAKNVSPPTGDSEQYEGN